METRADTYGFVYIIKNLINGKLYIGQTTNPVNYDVDNTYVRLNGHRMCRECHRVRERARQKALGLVGTTKEG